MPYFYYRKDDGNKVVCPWNDCFRLGSKARTLLEVELNFNNDFIQTSKDLTGSTHLIKMTCLKTSFQDVVQIKCGWIEAKRAPCGDALNNVFIVNLCLFPSNSGLCVEPISDLGDSDNAIVCPKI